MISPGIWHSERRTVFGDTDAVVAAKFAAARRAKLTPIFCVGETLEEREAGRYEALAFDAHRVEVELVGYLFQAAVEVPAPRVRRAGTRVKRARQ